MSRAWAVAAARMKWSLLALILLGVTLIACQGSTPATPEAADIRVLASWEGPEIDTFRAAVAPFEERTGHRIVVSTTRDLKGALERAIAAGDPPDLAGLPGPGYMLELVRNDQLVDLSEVIDVGTYKNETAPGLVEIGTVDDTLAGVFIKGTVKGLLWYDPEVYQPVQHRDLDGAPAPGDDRQRGWPDPTLVRRSCVGRGIRVARDRLDRGLRPQAERAERVRRLGRRPTGVGFTGHPVGLPGLLHGGQRGRRGRRCRGCTAYPLHRCRGRTLHRPATVPLRPSGHVHGHVPRRGRGRVRRSL